MNKFIFIVLNLHNFAQSAKIGGVSAIFKSKLLRLRSTCTIFAHKFKHMLIALQKRKENIAEYLLYMWQVEDIIRACNFSLGEIEKNIVARFEQPQSVRDEIKEWYGELINMMLQEGVKESGHIQINKNIVIDLNDLHLALLKSPKEIAYNTAFYRVLPSILDLKGKSGPQDSENNIELIFNALYGYMLLRLQKKEVLPETAEAVKQISSFTALLATKYRQEKAGELKLDEE